MLHIAICEDTPAHARRLASLLEARLSPHRAQIEDFPSPDELLRYIEAGPYAPDLAFLGVECGNGSGISLAEKLNEIVPGCRVVFLSDSLEAVKEAYRAEHVWFILRGELRERLAPALNKALSPLDAGRGMGLLIRGKGRAVFLPLEEILYLERDGRRTLIRAESGEYVSSDCPSRLLSGGLESSFVRSHRSYWVNKGKISAMERGEFVLSDGRRVPISRSWRRAARDAFFDSEN